MAKTKKKETGRPAGTPNLKSAYVRNCSCSIRVTEGFNATVEALIASGRYKSKSDVVHRAMEILAARELPGTFYWLGKIQ